MHRISSARWLYQVYLLAPIILISKPPAHSSDAGIPVFRVPETALTLRAEATSRRLVAAHGRRGMLVGYAAESLEGWIYPFRIFHDFRVGFRAGDSSDVVPGSVLIREVLVNPESVTRVYSAQNFTVRETLFVPLDLPGFEIFYKVEARAPLHIVLSFRPDLDLMWPGGLGGQSAAWDEKRRVFVLQESSEKYSALVGSPATSRHSVPDSYAQPWEASRKLSLELEVPAGSSEQRYHPLLVSLGMRGHYDATQTYDTLLESTAQLYREAAQHYQKLVSSNLQLETPQAEVNLAYSWARIALDQAYVCNPLLGCGLVAGYGPSRDTRRPQYAWFFGGDALINTWALEAAGDHNLACDAVRFIQKYQKKDTGEILHELSQSAGLIDWFKDYPYGYRHTDISALYLVAFRNLYNSSGDLEFLRFSWDSLRAAYNYLVSRIDSSDGLVTIPPGGWGGDETIGEQVAKDVYLESMWVAGGDAFAELAARVGERGLADEARARADKARASLLSKLWNPKRNFFFYGFNARGELLTQELGQPNWGIWLGFFDPDKAEGALDHMARANWEADWGLRSIPSDDPLYIGESYGHGSVWPLGTGAQALAFFRYHRPLQGNPLWRALVAQSFLNSLGHVPEVFSGEYYRELDVSVPEQIWSSGMVITSTLRGLLGLHLNAPMAQLSFAPHLPPNWPEVRLRNVKVGLSNVSLEMQQSDAEARLRVENSGPPVEILFSPEVPLGSKACQATLNGKRLPVTLQSHAHDAHAEVKFSAQARNELVIQFVPGVRVWVPEAALHIGDASRGLRILSSKLEGRSLRGEVEGRPGACSSFVLSTPWQVNQVKGGKVSSHNGNLWQFIVSPQADACASGVDSVAGNNLTSYQSWTFEVEFAP